jgi:hypothetical protein
VSELHDVDRRVAVLEQIAADTRQALQTIDASLRGLRDDMNREISGLRTEMERRFDAVDRRFVALEGRQWTNFYWLLGVMLGGYASLFAMLAHGFKWL